MQICSALCLVRQSKLQWIRGMSNGYPTYLPVTFLLVLVASCGGGGGSDANRNRAPVTSSPNADQLAYTHVDFSYDATQGGTTFSDPDGGSLSYTVSFSPSANGLSASGGTISGQITAATDITVIVTARDSAGATVSDSFEISGSESVAAANSCPATNSTDAEINSALSVILDADIDPTSVAADSISVVCAGAQVSGATSLVGSTGVQFVADNNLPNSTICEASLERAFSVGGRPVRKIDWAFTTGANIGFDWIEESAITIFTFDRDARSQPQFTNLYSFFDGGRHVVLFSKDGNLRVAVSGDGGATYSVSQALLDPLLEAVGKWDFDYDYDNGQFFIVFRSQGYSPITGLYTLEVMYLQSLTDLLTYSDVAVLTDGNNTLSAFSPGVAVDENKIYISWREEECAFCSPDMPGQGVYLAEFDRVDGTLITSGLVSEDGREPVIEAAGEVLMAWYRDIGPPGFPEYVDDLYNHSEGAVYPVDLSGGGQGRNRIGDLTEIDTSKVQRTWLGYESAGSTVHLNNFVFDYTMDVLTYNYRSVSNYNSPTLTCPVQQATDRRGSIATTLLNEEFSVGKELPIFFSSDSGETYDQAVTTTLWRRGWCPLVAVEDANTLYVTTVDTGQVEDPPSTDLSSIKYTRKTPCEL